MNTHLLRNGWSWFQCQITFTLPDNTGEKMRRNENGNNRTQISPDNFVNHWEKSLRQRELEATACELILHCTFGE